MKTRIAAFLLAIVITVQFASAGSLSNFKEIRDYQENKFSDIAESMWYAENISDCYELGLIDGLPGGSFAPSGYVTIAESIKMAVSLRTLYDSGEEFKPVDSGDKWYTPYVQYAVRCGIINNGGYYDYNARATRSDFASILANALPQEAVAPVNVIPDGAIPDVSESYAYGKAVYSLYRAGVLTGAGADGEFYPNLPVSRAEAATILLRMADATKRVYIQKAGQMSATELYEKCAPSVIFIQVYDKTGILLKTGSGFFINETGLAVTNSHVIADAQFADITLSNGEKRKILGIYGYDMQTDCALIQIEGSGYKPLEIGRYPLKTGADVYTIGNPIGLVNSFSKGIISMRERTIAGMTYIQIDAAISHGSSGGALLDAAGRVIGITSAAVPGGQSLNLAMPITVVDALDTGMIYDLGKVPVEDKLYEGFFPVPDFGEYSGLKPTSMHVDEFGTLIITYSLGYVFESEKMMDGYIKLLEKYSFFFFGEDKSKKIYYNDLFGRIVVYDVVGSGRTKMLLLEIS